MRSILLLILCLAMFGAGVWIIYVAIAKQAYIISVIGIFTMALATYSIINIVYNRVIFTENKIIMTGEILKKSERIQFKDSINYCEICDIRVIYTNTNSKKQRIQLTGYGSLAPRLYFEIKLNNGKIKRIYISGFSYIQKKKMLELINKYTGLNFDYKTIDKIDDSCFNFKKRKNKTTK